MAKRGRKLKRDPNNPKQPLSMTMPLELKRALEAAAAASGRSLDAEVRDRLARSLEADATPSR
jgi:hypothetical protein